MNDANEIMQALLGSQTQFADLAADDPQISYMISAWARICKILGEQFAAYLPLVMPPVMRAAEFKPEVTVMTGRFYQSFLFLYLTNTCFQKRKPPINSQIPTGILSRLATSKRLEFVPPVSKIKRLRAK
jgi:hypothetical protein